MVTWIGPKATERLAALIIVATCAVLLFSARQTWFLNCEMECGEAMLAIRAADRFAEIGIDYGLLENMGGPGYPAIYTHNVNIGGLMLVAAEALGWPAKLRLVLPAIVFAGGLAYVFATARRHGRSDIFAIITLLVFATTYWGLGAFALNALRAWHLLAFFAVAYHASALVAEPRRLHAGGLLFGALAAFGCGYDFWIVCCAVACAFVLLKAPEFGARRAATLLGAVAAIFALPFILRQIHVAAVLGPSYWLTDVLYTIAIKVPYADRIIKIPSMDEVDAFYRLQHVMRPPAQPGNTAAQIFFTFRHMVEFITVPRWGALSLLTLAGVVIAAVLPVGRRGWLRSFALRMIVPMVIGIVFGLVMLAPFSLHVYFKHEFPLIAFPILLAKAAVIYRLWLFISHEQEQCRRLASAAAIVIFVVDAAFVHWNNTRNGEYPNFEWLRFYNRHDNTKTALSTYRLMVHASPYLGLEKRPPARYFEPEDIARGAEPPDEFWIYQPTDYTVDFDRQIPHCHWTGWFRALMHWRPPRQPGMSCIYKQRLPTSVKPPPVSIDDVVAGARSFEVVKRNDLGIGYVILRRRRN